MARQRYRAVRVQASREVAAAIDQYERGGPAAFEQGKHRQAAPLNQTQQGPGQGAAPRGSFRPRGEDGQRLISMFEQADPSTFLHESAHFFLDMVVELEGQGQTALSADLDAIRKWVGSDDLLSVEAQEKFAEGFEQYLFEGTAPNAELRSAFRQFATWLRDVYRNVISNIGIMKLDINDEVRG